MNVLHVVPSAPFGGLQRVAALLAGEQQRSGINAHVLALYTDQQFQQLLQKCGVEHTVLHGSGPRFSSLRQYRQALAGNWSIVHLHAGLLWSNALALLGKKRPVIFHAHNYPSEDYSLKGRVLNRVNRSLVDLVIAVSEDVASAWRGVGIGSAVECVYNAIELPNQVRFRRFPRSTESPVFGITTRLTRDKGVFEFIDVAAAINALRPRARFIMAGDGRERSQLELEVKRRGLTEVFSFPGQICDLDQFWSEVDMAVFTAPNEPFGLRILEPMVRGVPVAAYLTGAGSDEIFSGRSIAATASYGNPEKLAEVALNVCDHPNLYAQIAGCAYDDVTARFSIAAMSQGVMRSYSRVIRV